MSQSDHVSESWSQFYNAIQHTRSLTGLCSSCRLEMTLPRLRCTPTPYADSTLIVADDYPFYVAMLTQSGQIALAAQPSFWGIASMCECTTNPHRTSGAVIDHASAKGCGVGRTGNGDLAIQYDRNCIGIEECGTSERLCFDGGALSWEEAAKAGEKAVVEAFRISTGKLGTPRTGRSIPDLPAEVGRVQAEAAGMQVLQTFNP